MECPLCGRHPTAECEVCGGSGGFDGWGLLGELLGMRAHLNVDWEETAERLDVHPRTLRRLTSGESLHATSLGQRRQAQKLLINWALLAFRDQSSGQWPFRSWRPAR